MGVRRLSRHCLENMAPPVSSLSALQRVLSSVPTQAWSTVSSVLTDGVVQAEVESFDGRRIMVATPLRNNRFAVRVENYPQVRGQNKKLGSVVEFTAKASWVEKWVEQAHNSSLNAPKSAR